MAPMEKHLKVSAIKDGTVLDHIPADQLFKVIDILGLSKIPNQITFGTNLDSKLIGKKAIIKITAYDFGIYGGLEGKIVEISADTIVDKDSKDGYMTFRLPPGARFVTHTQSAKR